MNKEFTRELIRLAGILLAVTLIVGAALGAVNGVTADRIKEVKAQKTQDAMSAIIKDCTFEQVDYTGDNEMIRAVYTAKDASGAYAGLCVKVAPTGFGGEVGTIVGISPENAVLGVEIVESVETSQLGSKAGDDNWNAQYDGKKGPFTVVKNQATGENDIVAISGATITSNAVTLGVQTAVDFATTYHAEVSK